MNNQVTILSPEQMATRIEKYMKLHADEIDVMIDKKIETSIKRAINDSFKRESEYSAAGTAEKEIKKAVNAQIKKLTNSIEVDQDELMGKINDKIQKKIDRVSVKLNVSL